MLDGKKWIYADHTVLNKHLIFFANNEGYKINLDSLETSYICKIKIIEYVKKRGVSRLIKLNDVIFIVSWNPLAIACYDIKTNEIKQIYTTENGVASFISVATWDNHIYLFRKNVDEMIVLNECGMYSVYPFLKGIDKRNMHGCTVGDKTFFFASGSQIYYKYVLNSGKTSKKNLSFSLEKLQDVAYFNQKFYFLGDNYIKIWDGKENVIKIDFLYKNQKGPIRGMIIPLKDKMFVLPRKENDIFSIGYDGIVSKYVDYPKGYHYTPDEDWLEIGSKYTTYVNEEGIYYFPRRATNYMLAIDTQKQELMWLKVMEPSVEYEIKNEINRYGKLIEKNKYLTNYINYIKKIN